MNTYKDKAVFWLSILLFASEPCLLLSFKSPYSTPYTFNPFTLYPSQKILEILMALQYNLLVASVFS